MILLIPSYSIEDFSVDRIDSEANQILSAWSALYHPALVEKMGRLPAWERAANPNETTVHQLIVIPPCCEHLVPTAWLEEKEESCTVIRAESDREMIVEEALQGLQLEEHGFEPWFVDAFYAFGTCYVLGELLTRQLRYMSMLDEYKLKELALNAIEAYRSENFDGAKECLQQIFEELQRSREYFYPMQAFFLDLTLTATTTLGEKLRKTLDENELTNLVLPAAHLRLIVQEHHETLESLKRAAKEQRLELIGDDLDDLPLTMLTMPDLVERLFRGIEFYRNTIGVRPTVYARRQPYFAAVLPSLLTRAGYQGMLLFTTDGWQTPEKRQSFLRWESPDGQKIGALVRYPFDANRSDTFLQFPKKLGRMLEGDHAPTIPYAHFPKHTKRWLNDLTVAHRYAQVFGRFYSMSSYFKTTRYSGKTEPLAESLISKSNHLVSAAEQKRVDPVSVWGHYHQLALRRQHILTLTTVMASLAGKKTEIAQPLLEKVRTFFEKFEAAKQKFDQQLYGTVSSAAQSDHTALTSHLRTSDQTSSQRPIDTSEYIAEADGVLSKLSHGIAALLTVQPDVAIAMQTASPQPDWGYLVINPLCAPRNVLLDVTGLTRLPMPKNSVETGTSKTDRNVVLTETSDSVPLLLAKEQDGRKEVVLEIPPLGYAWVGCANESVDLRSPSNQSESNKPSLAKSLLGMFGAKQETAPPLAEKKENGYFLRNETFELHIDAATGAVMSLFLHNTRGNRLAQQLAFRFPENIRKQDGRPKTDGNAGYSIMAADKIEIITNGPLKASLHIVGRLMHFDGSVVAGFEQTITVRRGNKIVEFEFKFDPTLEPGNSPWDSYYTARFAWGNTAFEPTVGISSGKHSSETRFIESPYFVDFRDESQSLTIYNHGLPYHRRVTDTRIDTILIPVNERQRTFRVDVGISIDYPFVAAIDRITPLEPFVVRAPKPRIPLAWLFSIDSKNVVLQKCEPLFSEIPKPEPESHINTPFDGSQNDLLNDSQNGLANGSSNDLTHDTLATDDAISSDGASERTSPNDDNPTVIPGYGYDGVYAKNVDAEVTTNALATVTSAVDDADLANANSEGTTFRVYPNDADCLCDTTQPLTGMRLSFLETEGRPAEVTFRSFRPIQSACVTDFEQTNEKKLTPTGDKVTFSIKAHEFLSVEIRF